jgi:spermidine synthase
MEENIEILYKKMGKEVILNKNDNSLVYQDNGFHCSGVYLNEVYKSSFWTIPASIVLTIKPQNILLLGGGGGCMVQTFRNMYHDINIDVVDIDDTVADIFNLFCQKCHTDGSNINLIIEDAFDYLKKTSKVYDFIVVDIFCNDRLLDFLTSISFWKEVYEHVSEKGIVVWNTKMRNWFFANEKDNPLYLLIDEVYMARFKAVYLSPLHGGGWLYICKNNTDLLAETKKICRCCDNKYLEAALITNCIYMRYYPPRQKCEKELKDISERYSDFIFAGLVNFGRKKKRHLIDGLESLFAQEVYLNYRDRKKRLDLAYNEDYYEKTLKLLNYAETNRMDSILLPSEKLISRKDSVEGITFFKDMSLYLADEDFEIDGLRKMKGYT